MQELGVATTPNFVLEQTVTDMVALRKCLWFATWCIVKTKSSVGDIDKKMAAVN